MTELRTRLEEALGAAYRVERELGGGGMSRVFLAEEVRLGRRVVVKVLPPELAAGVSKDRFEREIHLAARLQHPHIVPLLTAGWSEELLYYIMPFIEGETLGAKLAREVELPIPEALRIVRDVADALAYAHRHQLVHRDIKPDNVLLSEGHALVTDFGVAKALAASSEEDRLTSAGIALGTPLYMAPEQGAADPHTDHRADIYALGVVAYEMVCGTPPFTGRNAQAVLAAHLMETAQPLTRHRPSVSEGINTLILRCLEKKPADRWQQADHLVSQIEVLTSGSGAVQKTGQSMFPGTHASTGRLDSLRVAAVFALMATLVLATVYGLVQLLGLPDWVLTVALGLLVIGAPIVLLTGHHERQRALTRSRPGSPPSPPGRIQQLFTWRTALYGGALAFAGLGVVATAYSAMRALGVGPAGTLVARGAIREREPLIVADFENLTGYAGLGASITEALRIDLSQSPIVTLLDGAAVTTVLRRMGRDAADELHPAIAREVAEREGAKAFVAGEIAQLGSGYLLTVRVISADSGVTLVALRETAADQNDLIKATDRLSARLRERLGESLRTIRASQPLENVTTSSIEALRRFSRASQVYMRGNYTDAIPLLEAAIEADSTFAMAYRRLSVAYFTTATQRSQEMRAARKAFEYRHRLAPVERYLAEAWYYDRVEPDRQKAIAAYESILEEIDPRNIVALINLSLLHNQARRYREAETLALRAMQVGDAAPAYAQASYAQAGQGKFAAAESTLARFAVRTPTAPNVWITRARLAATKGDFPRAASYYDSLLLLHRGLNWRGFAQNGLADLALLRGQLGDAERWRSEAMASNASWGAPAAYLDGAVRLAAVDVRHRRNPQEAVRKLEAALARHPLSAIPAADRPYLKLAELYAAAGDVGRARRLMAEYESSVEEALRRHDAARHAAVGAIAMAEGRMDDAVTAFRLLSVEGSGPFPGLVQLAEAFDRARNVDSALAYYHRFLSANERFAATLLVLSDVAADAALVTGSTYRRVGELYEERGDHGKAIEYYGRFVELWRDADPGLQPLVRDIRQRIVRLRS